MKKTRNLGMTLTESLLAISLTTLIAGGVALALGQTNQQQHMQLSTYESRMQGERLLGTIKAQGPLLRVEEGQGALRLTFATGEIDPCGVPTEWPTRSIVLERNGVVDGESVAPLVEKATFQHGTVTTQVALTMRNGEVVQDHIPTLDTTCTIERISEMPRIQQPEPAPVPGLPDPVRAPRERPQRERPGYYSDREGNLISAEEWSALDPADRYLRSEREGYSQPEPAGDRDGMECWGTDCRPSHWKPLW